MISLILPWRVLNHSNKYFVLKHPKYKSVMVFHVTQNDNVLDKTYLSTYQQIDDSKIRRLWLWTKQDSRLVYNTGYYIIPVPKYLEMVKHFQNIQIHLHIKIFLYEIWTNNLINYTPTPKFKFSVVLNSSVNFIISVFERLSSEDNDPLLRIVIRIYS